ncbi:F-box/WD repeat-containing protein 12 [Erinaceus europaeus]|uniref:F-box/WD repeat-containing protein 12 n=1 Tax=Erinaceus europaeus TaxID=9365 RepID=A0ABM3YIJ7_ERIEU|nr:F-box/WD repeat-containing protein 12 [Erinaceus europaeus]
MDSCNLMSQFPTVPLLRIFSFLDGHSLIKASQVNKHWNKVAETDSLWRDLCLKKGSFCHFSFQCQVTIKWKQLYFKQMIQKFRMFSAQSEDFNCKITTEDLGNILCMTYLAGSDQTMDGEEKSIVFVASTYARPTKYVLTAWDVQKVGDGVGDVHTLTLPELHRVFQVNAFNYSVDMLCFSPDKTWIIACGRHQTISPTVFFSETLLKPEDNAAPLSVTLRFSPCIAAHWAPRKPNRIVLMVRKYSSKAVGFVTLDLTIKMTGNRRVIQETQIASFLLPPEISVPFLMSVSLEDVIILESGSNLCLFSIGGVLLQQFNNHQQDMVGLWTDSVHVITLSLDNSLHLYMWDERNHPPSLKSCCHLNIPQEGDQEVCFYTVKCDNVSIVCVVSEGNSCRLVMYCLKT